MKPHHVLHLLGSAQPEATGIARFVEAVVDGSDPARFRFHAWFLGENGPLVAELENHGVFVHVLPWRLGLRDPLGMLRFYLHIRREQFSIVHQHFGGRGVRWAVRLNRGPRLLVHLHGPGRKEQRAGFRTAGLRSADCAIAVSRSLASGITSIPVEVIHPCVPTHRFLPPAYPAHAPNGFLVGTAARFVPEKGLTHLIRAMSLVQARVPNLQLEIVGSGPEESALRKAVQELGIAEHVRFLSWQADLGPLFQRWDVFVLPSLEEPFGLVVVEAMAAALPIVATNVGGIPEIVEHGKTGLLVPPADPAALADSLALLFVDPEKRTQFGLAGWARAREKFSQESMVSAVEDVYERLLARQSFCTGRPASRAV